MKTDLFVKMLAICILMMTSWACQDVSDLDDRNEVQTPSKVKLTVVVPVHETKLTSNGDEGHISNYQVYIFDDGGVLESYVNQASSDIVLDCTAGTKTVAVLANAPAIRDVTSLSVLTAKTSSLADNGSGALIMAGQQAVTVSADKEVTVSVSRLVAKIRLSELQVSFEAPQYQNMAFKVSAVYLINVPAVTKYFSAHTPTIWYNKQKYVSADANALIYDDMKSVAVTSSSPYKTTNTFYCYPNPAEQDTFSTTWSARHTRLVVEAYLGSTLYYYPVTLPELEKNKVYDVKLTVTRPGTSIPDDEVDKYSADFTISVKAWETGASVSEEI